MDCTRIRAQSKRDLPDTVISARLYIPDEKSRPTGMRVVTVGDSELDDRFETFVEDDRGKDLWARAAAQPAFGSLLPSVKTIAKAMVPFVKTIVMLGELAEITVFSDQITAVLYRNPLGADEVRPALDAILELERAGVPEH